MNYLKWFGRIGNEIELFKSWFKLITDGLGLLGNGKFTRSKLDMNSLWTGYRQDGHIEDCFDFLGRFQNVLRTSLV